MTMSMTYTTSDITNVSSTIVIIILYIDCIKSPDQRKFIRFKSYTEMSNSTMYHYSVI